MKLNRSPNEDKKHSRKTYAKEVIGYVITNTICPNCQKVIDYIKEQKVSICITLFLGSFVLLFLSISFVEEDEIISNTFTFWSALVCVIFLLIWLGNIFSMSRKEL